MILTSLWEIGWTKALSNDIVYYYQKSKLNQCYHKHWYEFFIVSLVS